METYAPIAMILALGATVSCWNLRLERICMAGEPSGTNHTLVLANTFLGCASACDDNVNCFYVSFNGTACVIYENASPCGTGVGPTRDVYKVEPTCEPGWYRFGGSCYLVNQNAERAPEAWWICESYAALPVAINNAAEGAYLTQLLLLLNIPDTTVWLGGTYYYGPFVWYGTNESAVYQNWDNGEPDNLDSEICVIMNLSNAKWKTENCGLSKISACEKTP